MALSEGIRPAVKASEKPKRFLIDKHWKLTAGALITSSFMAFGYGSHYVTPPEDSSKTQETSDASVSDWAKSLAAEGMGTLELAAGVGIILSKKFPKNDTEEVVEKKQKPFVPNRRARIGMRVGEVGLGLLSVVYAGGIIDAKASGENSAAVEQAIDAGKLAAAATLTVGAEVVLRRKKII